MSTTLVFVYGTLKTGEPNHGLIEHETRGSCVPRGKAMTADRYPLVVAARHNIPFLLYQPGTGEHVVGELYEVSDDRLAVLDELECHPHLYERRQTTVIPQQEVDRQPRDMLTSDSNGQDQVIAHAYFLVKFRKHMLNLPMINTYTDMLQGKKYVGPSEREVYLINWWFEVHADYKEGDPDKSRSITS